MQRNNFKVHNVDQGTQEWLALRESYHTASQAGVAMGVAKPLGEISPHLQKRFDYGHKVEEMARPSIEAKHFGFGILKTPTATCEIDGIKLLASLDGYCDGVIWECKSYGFDGGISKDAQLMIDEKVPEKHYWQMQHQMMVFGASKAYLTAATTNIDENDNEVIYCNKPILIEANEADQLKLLKRYKEMATESVEADDSMDVLFREYAILKQQAKDVQEKLKACEDSIKSKAKESGAKHIVGNGFKVDMVERKGSVDYKSIPELNTVNLDDYRTKPSMFFQIKQTKK
jgi:predicted phage-related endonuclease